MLRRAHAPRLHAPRGEQRFRLRHARRDASTSPRRAAYAPSMPTGSSASPTSRVQLAAAAGPAAHRRRLPAARRRRAGRHSARSRCARSTGPICLPTFFGHEPWAKAIHRQMLAAYDGAECFLRLTPGMTMADLSRCRSIAPVATLGRDCRQALREQLLVRPMNAGVDRLRRHSTSHCRSSLAASWPGCAG
jgi:hypothetical protein